MLRLRRAPLSGALSLLFLLGVVLSLILLSFFPQVQAVVIRADGKRVLGIPAASIEGFTYSFTHSVERSTVRDSYVVRPDGMIINTYTAQKSFGAGLPSGGVMDVHDGYYRFEVNVELESLCILVSKITEQRIEIGAQTVYLTDFPDGTEITVSSARVPLIWLRLKEVLR